MPALGLETMERRYQCFLSYRHADNRAEGRQWATWLHHVIETYDVPADIVGTRNERGGLIPSRIFPVFRDEEELPADADLSQPIAKALENSETLLVLCSPGAVASRFVSQEVLRFKALGRKDRVLAAIVSGEPNAAAYRGVSDRPECFPEGLRYEVDEDGNITSTPAEPIAADFRLLDGSEGWTNPEAYHQALVASGETARAATIKTTAYAARLQLMVLKIIAGILGVPLGLLTRRDKEYQLLRARRRARALALWLSAVTTLTVAALFFGLLAARARSVAERMQGEAEHARIAAEELADHRKRDSDLLSAAILPLVHYGVFKSPDNEIRPRVMEMIHACGGAFQPRFDPQSLANSVIAANMCQMIAAAAVEADIQDVLPVLSGQSLPAEVEQKLRTAIPYAEQMSAIYKEISSRPPMLADALRDMRIDETTFAAIRSESRMLIGSLHLYLGETREAERELAEFVAGMLEWEPPGDAEAVRNMDVFEAATNLAQAYRLNGKLQEAVDAASLAMDCGVKWAAEDTNKLTRVAIRSLALEHFGLLDEPHRQRQEALLKKASLFDDVIEEAKAVLQGTHSSSR